MQQVKMTCVAPLVLLLGCLIAVDARGPSKRLLDVLGASVIQGLPLRLPPIKVLPTNNNPPPPADHKPRPSDGGKPQPKQSKPKAKPKKKPEEKPQDKPKKTPKEKPQEQPKPAKRPGIQVLSRNEWPPGNEPQSNLVA